MPSVIGTARCAVRAAVGRATNVPKGSSIRRATATIEELNAQSANALSSPKRGQGSGEECKTLRFNKPPREKSRTPLPPPSPRLARRGSLPHGIIALPGCSCATLEYVGDDERLIAGFSEGREKSREERKNSGKYRYYAGADIAARCPYLNPVSKWTSLGCGFIVDTEALPQQMIAPLLRPATTPRQRR